jgi:ferritin-like protein
MESNQLTQLNNIARGRDHLNTEEFAQAFLRKEQTARKNYCLTGSAWGVTPIKRFGRLMWPVSDVAKVLVGECV